MTKLSAFICYKDTNKIVEWLTKTFGFTVALSFNDESTGKIAHAELKLDDTVVIVQQDTEGYDTQSVKGRSVGQGLYLMVESKENVDKLYEQAKQQHATILVKPEETEWGNYHIEVLDPEGKQWSIATYMPGEANW